METEDEFASASEGETSPSASPTKTKQIAGLPTTAEEGTESKGQAGSKKPSRSPSPERASKPSQPSGGFCFFIGTLTLR
jgi:hypothetical protein